MNIEQAICIYLESVATKESLEVRRDPKIFPGILGAYRGILGLNLSPGIENIRTQGAFPGFKIYCPKDPVVESRSPGKNTGTQ